MLYIYTVCYNTPQYIEPQYKLLQKYIKNEFEYIVFNNTMTNSAISQRDINNNNMLQDVCKKHNIKVFNLPRELFRGMSDGAASGRAGTAIDFAHRLLFSNYSLDSTFFLIDSDAFLLTPFDIHKFMENKKLSGRIQYRKGRNNTIKYITNHVVIFKPNEFDKNLFLKYFSFLPCNIDNVACDCGGNINFLFNEMGDDDFINWKNNLLSEIGNQKHIFSEVPFSKYTENYFDMEFFNLLDSNIKDFIITDTKNLKKKHFFCEIFANDINNVMFLHLRAGTNWIGWDFKKREQSITSFLNLLLTTKAITHNST